jgi:hypothetical protein
MSAAWVVGCGNGVQLAGDADGFVVDAPDAAVDEGRPDITPDTTDAEAADSEVADEGGCGLLPATPEPLAPLNGAYSGSLRGPEWTNALRPLFRWRRASGDPCLEATTELQLDDSCPPSGFDACDLPTPEAVAIGMSGTEWRPPAALPVDGEPPVGRRYFWRLRSCNAVGCSPWSSVRYLDVGRVADDPNGDGYADLAVGDPNNRILPECSLSGIAPNGSVDIYYGGPDGLDPEVRSVLCDPIGSSASQQFGLQLAWAGDVDADGFGDLLVTAFRGDMDRTTDNYHVFLYYGSAGGIDGAPDVRLDNPTGSMTGDFGSAIASTGDLNADGFADIAVGARAQDRDSVTDGDGAVFLYRGADAGLELLPVGRLESPDPTPGSMTCSFGMSLVGASDLDLDGRPDLAVGAPTIQRYAAGGGGGSVYLFLGEPTGISETPALRLDNPEPARDEYDNGAFGVELGAIGSAAAPAAELVVGASSQTRGAPQEGNVFAYSTLPGGPSAVPDLALDSPDNRPDAYFGARLASADLDQDGHAELIVGAPDRQVNWGPDSDGGAGTVFVYRGAPGGLAAVPEGRLAHPDGIGDAGFGSSICVVADADGDGYHELAVGAPFTEDGSTYAGRVFVYSGGPGGLGAGPTLRLEGRPGFDCRRQCFGYAVR